MIMLQKVEPRKLSLFLTPGYLTYLDLLHLLQPDALYKTLIYLGESDFWKIYNQVIFRRHLYPGLHQIFSDPNHEFWRQFIREHYSEQEFPNPRLSRLGRLIYWRLEGQK